MSDKTKFFVDIWGVALGRLVPLSVVQLAIPLELEAGQELLHLQANVHGEWDDVVVEHHPQQEHLKDPEQQLRWDSNS